MSFTKRSRRADELGFWKGQIANLRRTPILLSDSKGHVLRNVFNNTSKHLKSEFPEVWCRSGSRTHHCVQKLSDQLSQAVERHGRVLIYIWAGTCDLCRKNCDNKLAIRTPNSYETVNDIVVEYNRALDIARPYGDRVVLRFLDCPIFSIVKWNDQHDCGPTPDSVDLDIADQINWLNHKIRNINWQQGQLRLNFNNDLIKFRKSRGRHNRYTYTARPLKDGIHPDTPLAKAWCVLLIKDLLDFQD